MKLRTQQNADGIEILDANNHTVAYVVQPEQAAVLAAAPELLAALEKLVRVIDRMPANAADGIADKAREVIAKAKSL